jgi:hypothetical protein
MLYTDNKKLIAVFAFLFYIFSYNIPNARIISKKYVRARECFCGNKHESQTNGLQRVRISEKCGTIYRTNSRARGRFYEKIARQHRVITCGVASILNVKPAMLEFSWS